MTVLWGMVFGSAMHSLTMGICMGLMMGPFAVRLKTGNDEGNWKCGRLMALN